MFLIHMVCFDLVRKFSWIASKTLLRRKFRPIFEDQSDLKKPIERHFSHSALAVLPKSAKRKYLKNRHFEI